MILKRHLILPLRSGRDGHLIILEGSSPVLQQLSAREGLGVSAEDHEGHNISERYSLYFSPFTNG